MSVVRVVIGVAIVLACEVVIGLGIACEVENPYGRCGSSQESCFEEHGDEVAECSNERQADANEANMNLSSVSQPVCTQPNSCDNPGWFVNSTEIGKAARCRPDLNVTFRHFNEDFYNVEVYWNYAQMCEFFSNLVGLRVILDGVGLICSDDENCCYCLSTNATVGMEGKFNITLKYDNNITPAIAKASVLVSTFPKVETESDGAYSNTHEFSTISNCYDPRLPPDVVRCGTPRYGKPTNIQQHISVVDSVTDGYTEINATLLWDPPVSDIHYPYPQPTDYYVRIQADSSPTTCNSAAGTTHCFKITNSTQITFTNLNASKTYYAKVRAYRRCSGIWDKQNDDNGCGPSVEVELTYREPNDTTIPATDKSSQLTAIEKVGIASVVIVASLTALTVVLCITTIAIYRHNKQQRNLQTHSKKPITDIPLAEQSRYCPRPTSIENKSFPPLLPRNPYTGEELTGSPTDEEPPSVLVVYSDRTHEKEKAEILQTLIGALRKERGIRSTCHDYFLRGDCVVFQIEENLEQASAVLCICNPAFCADWNSERPPPVINALKQMIGGEIASGGNLSKFATVFLYAQDKEQCIPCKFLKNTRQFLINDLEGIVGFVKNVPNFEIIPVRVPAALP